MNLKDCIKHDYKGPNGGPLSEVYLMDCLEALKQYPDNYFTLSVVDPPYGLGKRTTDGGSKKNTQTKFMDDIRRNNWDDEKPNDEYFFEFMRVSKNYIIWGGNYFKLYSYREFVVWDKMTYIPTMSRVELAVTSFDGPAKLIQINSNQPDRIHPTQKPVKLYEWIYKNYAKEGDKILDTHLGSQSNRIAAYKAGLDFTGFENDLDYFNEGNKRFEQFAAQLTLF